MDDSAELNYRGRTTVQRVHFCDMDSFSRND